MTTGAGAAAPTPAPRHPHARRQAIPKGELVAAPLQCRPVIMKTTTLVGRILYSLIFLMAVPGHFKAETIAYATAQGVPLADLAVPASGLLALVGALSVALGYKARWGALGLIAFLVPVTFTMHNFWTVADPMMHQLQLVMFMKNVALIGTALFFVANGAGAYSLDARQSSRRDAIGGRFAAAA